ncbi:MAG: VWA domain-containing protein [Desulfobulbaceae bacterium]|nr:VWA domain-containing protein [Candidatus Kapabacteria bacterium]MBS4001423.1 VWA domain-containing protein [Desulfobulbaceae bacterium]
METKHKVFNLIILDESGSMDSIKNSTISGFNEIIQTIQEVEKQFPEQEHFVSFVTFNGVGIKTLLFNQPVATIQPIDERKYQPNSSTPLYDAMGYSINKLRVTLLDMTDYNVLVTILTDGEENSSREYNSRNIKNMVEELKTKNWTFTYIGANHDVHNSAISISIDNTLIFNSNVEDVHRMFDREKSSRMSFSRKIRLKEDLQKNYYDEESPEKPSSV